ncbi:TfoX/Sxy family protein [Carboxylicivirga marina]|uniref:TfoX/Sxy family protein n=1 Tax=Carboxylicivirga marina TaxID=2800988 RepID=A0ABS1HKR2_9BACT|nr:TfoX/Sxy family protein [Carboxylicivirga marina]MBK3518191.1 TfoX/Sxy family protein [Carboxylicivirga marina]
MAYDEHLADRIRQWLKTKNTTYLEKKMMGGLCFMVDDKMCVGVVKNDLMTRVNPEDYETLLQQPGAKAMNFTGRTMKGFVMVEPQGIDMDDELDTWIQHCLDFNPLAKSSKKKK